MRSLEQRRLELLRVVQKLEDAAYRRGWTAAQDAALHVISAESPTIGTSLTIHNDSPYGR